MRLCIPIAFRGDVSELLWSLQGLYGFGWCRFGGNSVTTLHSVRILQRLMTSAFKVFIHANNFLPQLYDVFPATHRLVHVCAAVLPAQSKSATP